MSRKREKIIEELKELKSFLSDSYGETLDYAIESMKVDLTYDLLYEQVESDSKKESCNDCISRQAAINSLGECPMNWTDSDGEITAERDWKDTVEMLKSLPSVNPQPKTEVLDKIRDEIDTQEEWLSEAGYNAYNVDIAFNSIKRVIAESEDKE